MRWLPLAFLLTGCFTTGSRYYVVDATLPDGDAVGSFWVPWYGHSVLLSVPGLDLEVVGSDQRIAQWFSPWPLPPIIPLSVDAWDQPGEEDVVLELYPRRSGWSLVPKSLRMRLPDGSVASASSWVGPLRFQSGTTRARPETHDASEPVIADARMIVYVHFPVQSPLEGNAELELSGLALDGHAVELPCVGLSPRYAEQGEAVP